MPAPSLRRGISREQGPAPDVVTVKLRASTGRMLMRADVPVDVLTASVASKLFEILTEADPLPGTV